MPLYKTIRPDQDTVLHIWKIEEDLDWLAQGVELTPHCQARVSGMKSELHRRGFLSIRKLLAIEGYQDSDLYYDQFGKPHLKDNKYISITHSFNFSGIIIGKDEVGIDIEMQRPKINRIAHKFTTLEDYEHIPDPETMMRKLTIVWGAKESLYKSFAQPGLSFRQHIDVLDFELKEMTTTARIDYNGIQVIYRVWFVEFEGFTCAYVMVK